MIALPLTLLALGWALSLLLRNWNGEINTYIRGRGTMIGSILFPAPDQYLGFSHLPVIRRDCAVLRGFQVQPAAAILVAKATCLV